MDRTVLLSHELLMEMDDVTLHLFVGGIGIRTGADRFLGEANFFPSVKDGSFVASPSEKWRLHTLGSFGRSVSSMPRASSHCCLSGITLGILCICTVGSRAFVCLQTMHDLPVGILYLSDSYVQKRIQAADIDRS